MGIGGRTRPTTMNQLCKVCGEPAAGFHFGAFTCEGCKSFFGRTYNNLSSISDCKNNGECVINKKNRTACKACRLRKCLLVGMSKSGSRYGRRSNWFKIHCLLQEQQQAGAAANMAAAAAAANLLRPHPYLSPLFRTNNNHLHQTTTTTNASSESDSGASSADLEDDCFGEKRRRRVAGAAAAASISPASLPSVSPGGVVVPKWLPPLHGIGDPSGWRDLWLRAPPPPLAITAPDQDQPIDLSVKGGGSDVRLDKEPESPSDNDGTIDVGVEETARALVVTATAPLDLTLDR